MLREERLARQREWTRCWWLKLTPERREAYLERRREWKRKDYQKRKAAGLLVWQPRDRNLENARFKEYWVAFRLEMQRAYGGCCACCGETEPLFLTLDHIHNDGAPEKRKLLGEKNRRSGYAFYQYLKKNGWPKDRLQLLCYNCNCGRHRNGRGACPHVNEVAYGFCA